MGYSKVLYGVVLCTVLIVKPIHCLDIGDVLSDVGNTIGNAAQNGINAVGNLAENVVNTGQCILDDVSKEDVEKCLTDLEATCPAECQELVSKYGKSCLNNAAEDNLENPQRDIALAAIEACNSAFSVMKTFGAAMGMVVISAVMLLS